MTINDSEEKERIAQRLTGKSYADLCQVRQNLIDGLGKGEVEDPFAMLRRG